MMLACLVLAAMDQCQGNFLWAHEMQPAQWGVGRHGPGALVVRATVNFCVLQIHLYVFVCHALFVVVRFFRFMNRIEFDL